MPRESKKKTPKKKTKEKSTKESETPKMDEDEINRLMQNAFDQANARAEQRFEDVALGTTPGVAHDSS